MLSPPESIEGILFFPKKLFIGVQNFYWANLLGAGGYPTWGD